jgi:hypothetical protein
MSARQEAPASESRKESGELDMNQPRHPDTLDPDVASDLRAFGDAACRDLPDLATTRRELQAALAHRLPARRQSGLLRSPQAGALALAAAVLLVPIPRRHQSGWDATLRSPRGDAIEIRVAARNADEARRRAAAAARTNDTDIRISPHLELTWSSVYAMARDRLLRIDVALEGKTDEEAAAEIRLQLAEQGWTPTAVNVSRDADTIVHLSAEDEAGRQLRFLQRRLGQEPDHITIEQEPIDQSRDPGMTDAELREKILAQLRARGFEGDVTVEGERVLMRAQRRRGTAE